MARRKRDYAAVKARESRLRFLRTVRAPLALIIVSWVLGVVLLAIQRQWIAPYAAGAAVVGLGWLVHWLLWTGDGAFWQRMGSKAQGWTREEFRKIRTEGWTDVGPLVFERDGERFDVDMAAVGPRGVYAVETKYTTDAKLTASNARSRMSHALWQAKQGASDVADLLALHDVTAEVKPVLVLWGPGAPDFEKGWDRLKGVTVVAGRQADTWRPMLKGDRLKDEERLTIAERLRELDRSKDPFPL